MSSKPIALVVGDVMLDRRTEGEMRSISREAPAPVIRVTSQTESLGGAGNVAVNIRALDHEVMLMGNVGCDAAGDTIIGLASSMGIMACLPKQSEHRTTVKHRVTCNGQIICRMDTEENWPARTHGQITSGLQSLTPEIIANIKVVVVADYAKGTMHEQDVVWPLRQFCQTHNIPMFVDARPSEMHKYHGVTLLKPNLSESLEMLAGDVHPGLHPTWSEKDRSLVACQQLRVKYGAQLVVVTRGQLGCLYTDPDDNFAVHEYGAVGPHGTDSVKDICGAGDTVMAALVVGHMEGKPLSAAVAFAMEAAGYVVQFYGVKFAGRDSVDEFAYQHGGWTRKLMTMEGAYAFVDRKRRLDEYTQIVLANGCFDGFHAGHLELLRFAKRQGDVLVVAYNDDASLAALKGPGRPQVPDSYRASHLALQECVDAVVRFDGDMEKLVRYLRPDVLVKGADAASRPIPGADYVAQHGGRLALCPLGDFALVIDRDATTK